MAQRHPERDQLGSEVRDRRDALGLSVRALASRAGISPAYVTAIETGRNPSTGRPPVPSAAILSRLAAALELDTHRLFQAVSTTHGDVVSSDHVLLYSFEAAPIDLLPSIEKLFGADVDHWLYIADPRQPPPEPTTRATICQWNLGAYPYETPHLDPADLVEALDREVRSLATSHAGQRVGIAITDCSAVMRYVQNASAEVGLERTWHEHVHRIWTTHLGVEPAIDVCAYRHEDVAVLGLTIDQLGTALELIVHHDRVVVITAEHDVAAGAAAIRRILQRACPAGISPSSWAELADAASQTLVTSYGRNPSPG